MLSNSIDGGIVKAKNPGLLRFVRQESIVADDEMRVGHLTSVLSSDQACEAVDAGCGPLTGCGRQAS